MFRSLIAVLLVTGASANDYYKGDTLVRKGVFAFYNYEFDDAVAILSEARIDFPEHPGVHLIWAASRWVRSQANSPVEETYTILENDLSEIHPIYNELVAKYEYDPSYQLYQGSALGLSARVSLGKKQWIRTLYRAYRGFDIINDIAKKEPGLVDAKLPIGIVEYFSGISNSILSWAITLYDLEPSTESGLHKMSLAADDGNWAWIEAKAILSNLYLWVENEPILALEHSKDLAKYFPNNYYFNLLYLESIIRTGNLDISSTIIKDMENGLSKLTSRQIEWYTPYLNYEKALLSFYQEDYHKTIDLVDNTIENYTAELDIILGNAYLLKGMAYDKIDDRGRAKECYHKCIALDNFSGAMIKAKDYLQQPYIRN